ncbi:MAG TPA: DUF4434 domain-containing protein, partial [Bacillota bacterium]|nr:DUF4434 domain-containing protein [Bacillota bacterium]
YSTHYEAKTTLINGENIKAKGYKYKQTYGTTDVCKAVLDAAEKLGMKVWLGTIHDSDFTSPVANMSEYKKIVEDSYAIIDDINAMYGDHPAFAGYYLSDETCDQWLNLRGGVDACRYVYKSQSDYIRSINNKALIMIAPAIWRSGKPAEGAENLYKMLIAENEGDKPIVDIVAAQDCLGRTSTLYVDNEVYQSYEAYVDEWAKAVRRAGCEFWHDAEVFEIVSLSKRYECIVESLTIEAKTSGSIIVFDIPHYFTTFPMTAYNQIYGFYKMNIMLRYVKYYSTWAKLDSIGGEQPSVITNDGREIETGDKDSLIDAPVKDKLYNEGFLVNSAPSELSNVVWHDFATSNGSGKKPQFAYYWDSEAFYVLLKTNDATSNYGSGSWWEGKDDLIQIWMNSIGETGSDILESDTGIRFYVHHNTSDGYSVGGECGDDVSFTGFSYAYESGTFVITMPWSELSRKTPIKNDNTAIAINIQYIDGADSSWSSSIGNNGRGLGNDSLYSY